MTLLLEKRLFSREDLAEIDIETRFENGAYLKSLISGALSDEKVTEIYVYAQTENVFGEMIGWHIHTKTPTHPTEIYSNKYCDGTTEVAYKDGYFKNRCGGESKI